jgi:ribosomal protein S18 acetylase RimI-like enzyme
VGIDTETVAQAFAETWRWLLNCSPGWWGEVEGGAVGGVTGVRLPGLNGVWAYDAHVEPEAIEHLLGRVASTGLPHCLQAREEAAEALAGLAARRGMIPDEDVPLMVLEAAGDLSDAGPGELIIRELSLVERPVHTTLAAAGFETDQEHFDRLITPEVAGLAGARCYVGEMDGEAVTTGFGLTRGEWVAIFNIATPPAHRRRGYGAAVTARAVRDGFKDGASRAWLQSSPAGRRVYEQLGFKTVSLWRCWIAAE